MRQVRESIEIGRPVEQVAGLWERAGQPGDEVELEDLGGRTRLSVIRTLPDEGFVERMVDVTFNTEGGDLKAELERFRIDVEAGVAPAASARGRTVGGASARTRRADDEDE